MKFAQAGETNLKTYQTERERKMKNNTKQFGRRLAFTIVELLTVITIIAILIGILVPSLRAVRLTARKVKQKSQMHAIDTALEVFNEAYGGYPQSKMRDEDGKFYGGAFKLAEALVGQDLLGFDPRSRWRADLYYSQNIQLLYYGLDRDSRLGPYMELENANAYQFGKLYPSVAQPLRERYVLCDVFRRGAGAQKIGMPILYYRADTFNKSDERPHDPNKYSLGGLTEDSSTNIYNYYDCFDIVSLGVPPGGAGARRHPMADMTSRGGTLEGIFRFYKQTRNSKVRIWNRTLNKFEWWPYNAESFILLSAGPDGLYGTTDDIGNFNY